MNFNGLSGVGTLPGVVQIIPTGIVSFDGEQRINEVSSLNGTQSIELKSASINFDVTALTLNGSPIISSPDLTAYLQKAGGTMSGAIVMGTNDITGIDDLSGPTNSRKADNIVSCTGASTDLNIAVMSGTTGKVVTDGGANVASLLSKAGGTMTGAIVMGTNDITGVDDFAGPTNSRKADNIVSCTGTSTNLNIAVMSGTTGKVVTDGGATVASLLSKAGGTMTGAINMGQQEINNVSAIRTTDTRILIGSSATIAGNGVSKNIAIGDHAVQTGASGNHVLIGGSALIPSSTGNMVVVGAGASGTGASCVVIGGGASTVGDPDNCVIVGSSSTANISEAVVLGVGASSTGASSVVLGRLAVSSANNAHVLGRNITNAIGDSFLIGDTNLTNIRSSSAICDLGTAALPFLSARVGALRLVTGANKTVGSGAIMVGGTVVVGTTAVSTGDVILLSRTAVAGTPGVAYISAINNNSDFTITSSNVADVSTFSWVIIKQT